MKAKILRHIPDIKESVGDIVDVTSVDHFGLVYIVVTNEIDDRGKVMSVPQEYLEIIRDEGLETSLKTMIVIMSVSAVVGLLLFVISELIQLSSFIGFMLCMSGYIATFTALRSVVRN